MQGGVRTLTLVAEHPGEFSDDGADDSFEGVLCQHPWWDLDFLPDDSGLGCSTCGETWAEDSLGSAVVVVWNAAKTALDAQGDRIMGLESLLSRELDLLRCSVCSLWGSKTQWIVLGADLQACPDHVGDAVELSGDSRMVDTARNWAKSSGIHGKVDLRARWLWERNVLASPSLADAVGDVDPEKAAHREVVIPSSMAAALGVPESTTSKKLSESLAHLFDVDPPYTRSGIAFLMGILSEAHVHLQDWIASNPGSEPDRATVELIADEVADRISPRDRHTRALVASDIFGQSLEEELPVDEDLWDGLLEMLGHRGAEAVLMRACSPSGLH